MMNLFLASPDLYENVNEPALSPLYNKIAHFETELSSKNR